MLVTKKMKLEFEEKGLRYCGCCNKVKDIELFYSKKMKHSNFTKCTRCRSFLSKEKKNKEEQKYVDEKRNTEWFKNYLEKREGKLKSTKSSHSYYKKMVWQSYFLKR